MRVDSILADEQFLKAAMNMISEARESICITTFKAEITTRPRGRKVKEFFDKLFEKSISGVPVRFLLNKVTKKGSVPLANMYAIQEMPKHGVAVGWLRNERCCHAKMIIVDGRMAIFGSHNLSVKSCHNNFEVSYRTYDQALVHVLQGLFDGVWMNSERA